MAGTQCTDALHLRTVTEATKLMTGILLNSDTDPFPEGRAGGLSYLTGSMGSMLVFKRPCTVVVVFFFKLYKKISPHTHTYIDPSFPLQHAVSSYQKVFTLTSSFDTFQSKL